MNRWSDVSVVLIALDEEDTIGAALDSIPPGAERIVADGGSTDRTAATARARGARVVPQDAAAVRAADGNFDVARDAAARQHAGRPWIFYLDADERVSAELAREIADLPDDTLFAGYDLPRINHFWGRPVRLLGEDRQVRLFRSGCGAYPGRALHEAVSVDGPVGHLAQPLRHENVRHWADVRVMFRRYVDWEAAHLGRRPSRGEALRAFDRRFSYYYLAQGAWRDGWRGLVVSVIYAMYRARVLRAARSRHA